MFSKAVLTFLAIGVLSVNVSATPVPADPRFPVSKMSKDTEIGRELPRSFPALSYRHLTFVFSVVGARELSALVGTGPVPSSYPHNPPTIVVLKREPASDEALD